MERPAYARKICKVCGDKALGFNFLGISCEPCKSFFRRNAPKLESIRCYKGGHCPIDQFSRRCCSKCRLDKCIRIGMDRSLIFSRLDKDSSPSKVSSTTTENSNDSLLLPSPSKVIAPIDQYLEQHIKIEIQKLTDNFLEYTEPILPIPRHLHSFELAPIEVEQIAELQNATRVSAFYDENRLPLIGEAVGLVYALNLAEQYVKKTIKLCKNIEAFKWLSQNDQVSLLRTFFTELMIIRFAFVYNREKDGFPVFEKENCNKAVLIRLNIIYEAKKDHMVYQCRQYTRSFHDELEQDAILRNLLIAQRLFQPKANVSNPEYIHYYHCLYSRLTLRYLAHKYQNTERASLKLSRLNAMLEEEMLPIKEMFESMFIETDANKLAVVLNELYCFKRKTTFEASV